MDFAGYETALKAWVALLTGIAAGFVVFQNAPQPRHNGVLASLSWLDGLGLGVDEVRLVDNAADAPAPNLEPVVVGQRTLTLQVSIESHNQSPAAHARTLAERLHGRVARPSSLAALEAAGLGFVDVGAVTTADYRVDDRWISRCLIEVRFNAVSCERDADGAFPALETAAVSGAVTTPTGAAVAPSLLPSDEVLP